MKPKREVADVKLREMQYALRHYFLPGCLDAAINSYALNRDFEADFLAVTRAGYVHEVEIKLSRNDFFQDFEKASNKAYVKRHAAFLARNPQVIQTGSRYHSERKHDLIQAGRLSNYFWFAVPKGLIALEDVPEYAGLLEISRPGSSLGTAKCLREAPRIHRTKADHAFYISLMRGMSLKTWGYLDEECRQLARLRHEAQKAAQA